MARGRVIAALAVDTDNSTELDAPEPLDRMPLPTLDERANFYLRAVHGDRHFTDEEYSGARDLLLRSMADDIIAGRSKGRSSDGASLSLGEQHEGLTAFANASLLLRASEKPAAHSSEAAPVIAHDPRAFLQQRPLFSAFPRLAAVCAAAAVAAMAGYWVAAITARYVPGTAPHNLTLNAEVAPQDPSSGSFSNPRMMAEAERELASALNAAQLGPDTVAALVKRGQELVAQGKFRLARLVLERAAEAKSASAALALARTYDPLLERSASGGDAPPDMAMARAWYEKAKELGSTEAAQRLSELAASVPAARPSSK